MMAQGLRPAAAASAMRPPSRARPDGLHHGQVQYLVAHGFRLAACDLKAVLAVKTDGPRIFGKDLEAHASAAGKGSPGRGQQLLAQAQALAARTDIKAVHEQGSRPRAPYRGQAQEPSASRGHAEIAGPIPDLAQQVLRIMPAARNPP